MRRREKEPGRGSVQALRKSILIYCGAVRTEPDYFEGLKRVLASQALIVKVRGDAKAPRELVRRAAAYRDRRPGTFDEVWCVVDVDEFDLTEAVAESGARQVSLAISNPCFELWLLLHHEDCRAHCAGYSDVASRLKKHVKSYDKARLNFGDYADGIGDAVTRARALGADHTTNQSTGVWRLVDTILEKQP